MTMESLVSSRQAPPHKLFSSSATGSDGDEATDSYWKTTRDSPRRLLLPELILDESEMDATQSERNSRSSFVHHPFSSLGSHFLSVPYRPSLDSYPHASSTGRTGSPIPLTKTGTTIVGVAGRDCVVLAADARATGQGGQLVADASCRKLHNLMSSSSSSSSSSPVSSDQCCWMAGAGTAADLQQLARQCRAWAQNEVALYSSSSSTRGWSAGIGNADTREQSDDSMEATPTVAFPSIHVVCHWLQSALLRDNSGPTMEAALIVGGLTGDDRRQPVLRAIHPHGSMDVVDRVAMGSGGLAAQAVLESERYRANVGTASPDGGLTMDEAVALAVRAVQAGMDNDLGSGSYVDVCVIARTGLVRYTERYTSPEVWGPLEMRTATSSAIAAPDESKETKATAGRHLGGGGGANGFGNRPLTIRSQRPWRHHTRNQPPQNEAWNDIIGHE